MKEEKTLHYCLKNLKSLMQFTLKFIYFSILFFKMSLAFLINFNQHLLKINIRFIHYILHYSRFVDDVASQYYYIYLKSKNEIKFD